MTTSITYETAFNGLYLPDVGFNTNLESLHASTNIGLQAFQKYADDLESMSNKGGIDAISADTLDNWTDRLNVMSGTDTQTGRASLDHYSTLTWQALDHQIDPPQDGEFNWYTAASLAMTTVFGVATAASVPAAFVALASYAVATGVSVQAANAQIGVEGGVWGQYLAGGGDDALNATLDGVFAQVDNANALTPDGDLDRFLTSLDTFEDAVSDFQLESAEFFLEQFAINWLQENVGNKTSAIEHELQDQAISMHDEIEFWEDMGFRVETTVVDRDLYGPWFQITEARYTAEIEVFATDQSADLNGVDHFSYKIWDDVHRNQRSDFRDLEDRPEELYVESRFGLDVEIA